MLQAARRHAPINTMSEGNIEEAHPEIVTFTGRPRGLPENPVVIHIHEMYYLHTDAVLSAETPWFTRKTPGVTEQTRFIRWGTPDC